ncbi:MAG: sugar-binding protein [Candidatus Margulisbacteria bacterium]|nr:sugar-binding protein [Candidatus Margulisiibacteriota bacterium]
MINERIKHLNEKLKQYLSLLSLLLAAVCLLHAVMPASAEHLVKQGVFLGVFREGAPHNMNYIKQFEQWVGKKPAQIMWYQDWAQAFPKEDAQNVINYGAVPHIVWEPWYWSDHNKIKLKDITSGKWDGYITSWAKAVKEFGHPIFLRPAHEFNMEGYPWGIVNNDKDPQLYVKAFRHIVDIFKREKATNAKFVWSPMNYSFPDESWNDWVKAYPGNDYVDWIGFDGYNWGTTQSWSDWQALKYLFRDQARKARKLWPAKPIMIAEFAASEKGGDKAAWIKEIPQYLRTSMRDIDAINWFDLRKEADWRINSSERSLAAFKQIMKDPVFSSSGEELASLTIPAEKTTRSVTYACRTGGVKLDGNLAEWQQCPPIVMKDASYFKEGLSWGGPTDLSGKVYLMYDQNFLYLAADVTDKIPMINKKERGDIWNGDAIEIVFTTDPSANSNRDSFERNDFQVGFGTGDGRAVKPSIWNWQRRRSPTGSEIFAKRVDNPAGYILEAKIPWSFFGSFVPSAGTKIGFDVALDDADYSGERERQLIWNGDYYFYRDPGVWGILEFK